MQVPALGSRNAGEAGCGGGNFLGWLLEHDRLESRTMGSNDVGDIGESALLDVER